MIFSLAAILTLMPPAAATHHDQAMVHYEAGRHDEAFAEFHAAYTAMTDPRRDRDDREQVLGTLRGMLLVEHTRTGAAEPLCRLQGLIQAHLASLRSAYPDAPAPPEIAGNGERLAEVTSQLAAFPAGACQPAEPAPVASPAAEPPPASTPPPPPPPAPVLAPRLAPVAPLVDGPAPKQLRVAGGVTLGISGALLGVMIYGIADEQRRAAAAREMDRGITGAITREQHTALLDDHEQAQSRRVLAIASGSAAAGTAVLGLALLLVADKRGKADRRRASLAPWWLTAGGGLTLRVQLP